MRTQDRGIGMVNAVFAFFALLIASLMRGCGLYGGSSYLDLR